MLPFDAIPAEGLDAYSITGVKEKNVIEKGEAVEVLKANTPYYVEASEGDYDFRGVARALFTSYSEGLSVGRYTNYSTQSDEYKLVDMDGYSAFVRQENQGIVPFECYMKIEESEEAGDVVFLEESSATAITQVKTMTDESEETYDLMGRKVSAKQTKGVLIVGGRKIVR